jgi:hypothetical protein
MILFKPQVELLVSTEQTLQRFADDVLVRRAPEESRIPLKHRVRFLVEGSRNYLLFLLGFFRIRAISSSPLLLVIQDCWVFCLQLCRRRSEEFCWAPWAVATPGAEGVGRLASRTKRGRYRPKFDFLLAPLRCSVAGYLLLFLSFLLAANGILAANPEGKPLQEISAPRKHPFAPPQKLSLMTAIRLNTQQFAHQVGGNLDGSPAGYLWQGLLNSVLRPGFRTTSYRLGKDPKRCEPCTAAGEKISPNALEFDFIRFDLTRNFRAR